MTEQCALNQFEEEHFEGTEQSQEEEKHFDGIEIEQCALNQPQEQGREIKITEQCPPNQPQNEGREITEQCSPNQLEEVQHFEDVFVCWKMENDSNTFIRFNNGVNQNKCAANQLINYLVAGSLRNYPVDIVLGEWYKIEYCQWNDEILILNIQPTVFEEKLFKTRMDNGIVQVFFR